jgi:thiosulfate dehydrogenase
MPKGKAKWLVAIGLATLVALVVAGCTTTTDEEEEEVIAEEEEEEEPATDDSIVRGGLVYDKWWEAADGASEPTEDNPLWSLQSTNTRSGADTWRCKECHGWDYKGIDGAYASGSHKTGFAGVYDAGMTAKAADILEIMKGGDSAGHDFSTVMGDEALQDVANFLTEGLIDDAKYINYSTKGVIGADLTNGKKLYDGACAACHGADGWMIDFGDEGVGDLANGNPWETLHKIRFGHPGTAMPSSIKNGWSTEDAADVLGYAQTLERSTEEVPDETIGGPPNIPADHAGRTGCPMCHEDGIAGAPKWPDNHAGRTEEVCGGCHEAAS